MQPLLALVPCVEYKEGKKQSQDPRLGFKGKLIQCFLDIVLRDIVKYQQDGVLVKGKNDEDVFIHPYVIGLVNDTRGLPLGSCSVQPPAKTHMCIHCGVNGLQVERTPVFYPGAASFRAALPEADRRKLDRRERKLRKSFGDSMTTDLQTERKQLDAHFPVTKNDAQAKASMNAVVKELASARNKTGRKEAVQRHGFKDSSVLVNVLDLCFAFVHGQHIDLAHNVRTLVKLLVDLVQTGGVPLGKKNRWVEVEKERRSQDHEINNEKKKKLPGQATEQEIKRGSRILERIRLPRETQVAAIGVFKENSMKIGDSIVLLESGALAFVIGAMTSISEEARHAMVLLLRAMEPIVARRIRKSELPRLHREMVLAVMAVETALPYWCCTSVLHTMLHVFQPDVGYVACLGPPRATWMLPAERWNGVVARLLSSWKNPSKNVLKKLEARYYVDQRKAAEEGKRWEARKQGQWRSGLRGNESDTLFSAGTEGNTITIDPSSRSSYPLLFFPEGCTITPLSEIVFKGTRLASYKKRAGRTTADYAHTLSRIGASDTLKLIRILELLRVEKGASKTFVARVVRFTDEKSDVSHHRFIVDSDYFCLNSLHVREFTVAKREEGGERFLKVEASTFFPVNCSILFDGKVKRNGNAAKERIVVYKNPFARRLGDAEL